MECAKSSPARCRREGVGCFYHCQERAGRPGRAAPALAAGLQRLDGCQLRTRRRWLPAVFLHLRQPRQHGPRRGIHRQYQGVDGLTLIVEGSEAAAAEAVNLGVLAAQVDGQLAIGVCLFVADGEEL